MELDSDSAQGGRAFGASPRAMNPAGRPDPAGPREVRSGGNRQPVGPCGSTPQPPQVNPGQLRPPGPPQGRRPEPGHPRHPGPAGRTRDLRAHRAIPRGFEVPWMARHPAPRGVAGQGWPTRGRQRAGSCRRLSLGMARPGLPTPCRALTSTKGPAAAQSLCPTSAGRQVSGPRVTLSALTWNGVEPRGDQRGVPRETSRGRLAGSRFHVEQSQLLTPGPSRPG